MWSKIKDFFLHSETIFLARLQVFVGVGVATFLSLDPSLFQSYIPTKWLPIYMLAIGILTEYVRRRHATDIGIAAAPPPMPPAPPAEEK